MSELLDPVPPTPDVPADDHAATLARIAAQAGVPVTVVDSLAGPTVTAYGLVPGRGVAPAKVEKLVDAWSLACGQEVRYVGPVRGRILVEVPNRERRLVRLGEVLDPDDRSPLAEPVVPIGWGTDGNPVRVALGRLPHMLVAGATGQGKSAYLNAVLVALLLQCGPDELRLCLVDPKRVELAPYARLPHLDMPVATDNDAAVEVLEHAVATMEARYALMETEGVRHYRELATPPPPLVLVIDELADLMLSAKKQVEPLVVRIAAKARAAGVHLIIGTQRPSVDVVTGLIKTNMPTRIGFRVMSMTDSRVLLDRNGAERLTGAGDGLLLLNGSTTPRRFQAPWVSDDEIVRVVASRVVESPPQEPQAPAADALDEEVVRQARQAADAARAALAASAAPAALAEPSALERLRLERRVQLEAGMPQLREEVAELRALVIELADAVTRLIGVK